MSRTLNEQIGETFIKDHHGIKTKVVLCEVLRNKVKVQCPERQDKFKVSIAEFQKKYRPEAEATA